MQPWFSMYYWDNCLPLHCCLKSTGRPLNLLLVIICDNHTYFPSLRPPPSCHHFVQSVSFRLSFLISPSNGIWNAELGICSIVCSSVRLDQHHLTLAPLYSTLTGSSPISSVFHGWSLIVCLTVIKAKTRPGIEAKSSPMPEAQEGYDRQTD